MALEWDMMAGEGDDSEVVHWVVTNTASATGDAVKSWGMAEKRARYQSKRKEMNCEGYAA